MEDALIVYRLINAASQQVMQHHLIGDPQYFPEERSVWLTPPKPSRVTFRLLYVARAFGFCFQCNVGPS